MAVVGDASRVENEDERFRGREKGEGECAEQSTAVAVTRWTGRHVALLFWGTTCPQ